MRRSANADTDVSQDLVRANAASEARAPCSDPETVDPVGDFELGAAACIGMGREQLAHLVEHGLPLGVGQHRHVAHRRDPLDHRLGRDRLLVAELRGVQRAEAGQSL